MKLPDWFVCLGEALMESEAPARCRTTTLTNAEREAVLYCVSCAQDYRDTLDVCEQPEKYDRATQMIEAAMRLAIPNVGPAPVEGQRTASVTDVGGAGPTLTDEEREAIDRGIDRLVGVDDMSAGAGTADDAAACTLRELIERTK